MKKVLITGGAGYIGLNITVELIKKDISVIIIDDMKNAREEYIEHIMELFPNHITFFKGDVCNKDLVEDIIKNENVDGIIHLAARKYVGESFQIPDEYMNNNLNSLSNILDICSKYNIPNIMFASSVTVYGNASTMDENGILAPISPYAETKRLGAEMIKEWYKSNSDKNVLIFRFANPLGANSTYQIGDHPKTNSKSILSHLITHAISGENLVLHGNNHPTKDGTSIRDYIHILDLARISMDVFTSGFSGLNIYNLGRGKGYSVLEMLHTTEDVTGKTVNHTFGEAAPGNVSVVETNIDKITSTYNIEFQNGLVDMITTEFDFHTKHKS